MSTALSASGLAFMVFALVLRAMARRSDQLCDQARRLTDRARTATDPYEAHRLLFEAEQRLDRADRWLMPWKRPKGNR